MNEEIIGIEVSGEVYPIKDEETSEKTQTLETKVQELETLVETHEEEIKELNKKVYHKGDIWGISIYQWFAGRQSGEIISVTLPLYIGDGVTSATINSPKIRVGNNTSERELDVNSVQISLQDGKKGMVRIDFNVGSQIIAPLVIVGLKGGTTITFN